MSKNTYKSLNSDSEEKIKKNKSNFSLQFFFLNNPKFKASLGLFIIFCSLYFFISSLSYLFTWRADQDKINLYWSDTSVEALNILGKLGAFTGHMLIYKLFGYPIFLLITIFFLFGTKLFFDIKFSRLKPLTHKFVFFTIWSSSFFGLIFSFYPIIGGAFGRQINLWGTHLMGLIGTFFILIFALLVFLIFNYDTIKLLKTLKHKLLLNPYFSRLLNTNTELKKTIDNKNKIDKTPIKQGKKNEKDITLHENKEETESTKIDLEEPKEKKIEIINTSTTFRKPEKIVSEDEKLDLKIEDKSTIVENEVDEKSKKLIEKYGEFNPMLDLPDYQFPSVNLLAKIEDQHNVVDKEELEANKNRIIKTLDDYSIKIKSIKATIGPTVTLYEIIPIAGVRISKIKNLEDDIALSLSALGIRIIAPIPGKGTIGIEVPNQHPKIVSMRSVITSELFQNTKFELPIALGKTITNDTFIFDLAKMPHLLMAGATGQGKSVGLNAILASLLYKKHPVELKFVLVDPKKVELTLYSKIERHFLAKLPDSEESIITDNQKVINTLNSLCKEMDARYDLLKKAMVRNIVEYNNKFIKRKLNPENGHKYLPYIVLVIDEFADLIMTAGKEVETPIARLAQLARAIGIHLIIATQRPSANIITGIIKANFPGRVAFRVASGIDSRTILDSGGADQLIGKGDMLISQSNELVRVQCAFIDTPEVESICDYIGGQRAFSEVFKLPEYVNESSDSSSSSDNLSERDELFDEAAKLIVNYQQGSASLLQRKMKIGYNRAGRIIDQLEAFNIIGPFEGSKARQVLIKDEETLNLLLKEKN